MMPEESITVLGIFVNDMTFVADQFPQLGETILGNDFRIGPGGKGTNQAVAASRAGASVSLISRVGNDNFGRLAQKLFLDENIITDHVSITDDKPTGVAGIHVDRTGENAIIVVPGAADAITTNDIDRARERISKSSVFLTQLEVPILCVEHSMKIAREGNVTTILNPAPAIDLPNKLFSLIDIITPNETEASSLTGIHVRTKENAIAAGQSLINLGVKLAIITLGGKGALLCTNNGSTHIEALDAGKVCETTGAGDAFNGALAAAIAEGAEPQEAVTFANAAAAISVTKYGTARAMAHRHEIDSLLIKEQR